MQIDPRESKQAYDIVETRLQAYGLSRRNEVIALLTLNEEQKENGQESRQKFFQRLKIAVVIE